MQPTSSTKDRPAQAMIIDAEKKGLITPGKTTLIEAIWGNMGISMAFMEAMKGYKMVLTIHSDAKIVPNPQVLWIKGWIEGSNNISEDDVVACSKVQYSLMGAVSLVNSCNRPYLYDV